MNFKNVVDDLTGRLTHADLAEALGVSVPTVRQAGLAEGAKARRSPPAGWEIVAAKLARQRAEHFKLLAARLDGSQQGAC